MTSKGFHEQCAIGCHTVDDNVATFIDNQVWVWYNLPAMDWLVPLFSNQPWQWKNPAIWDDCQCHLLDICWGISQLATFARSLEASECFPWWIKWVNPVHSIRRFPRSSGVPQKRWHSLYIFYIMENPIKKTDDLCVPLGNLHRVTSINIIVIFIVCLYPKKPWPNPTHYAIVVTAFLWYLTISTTYTFESRHYMTKCIVVFCEISFRFLLSLFNVGIICYSCSD